MRYIKLAFFAENSIKRQKPTRLFERLKRRVTKDGRPSFCRHKDAESGAPTVKRKMMQVFSMFVRKSYTSGFVESNASAAASRAWESAALTASSRIWLVTTAVPSRVMLVDCVRMISAERVSIVGLKSGNISSCVGSRFVISMAVIWFSVTVTLTFTGLLCKIM